MLFMYPVSISASGHRFAIKLFFDVQERNITPLTAGNFAKGGINSPEDALAGASPGE